MIQIQGLTPPVHAKFLNLKTGNSRISHMAEYAGEGTDRRHFLKRLLNIEDRTWRTIICML